MTTEKKKVITRKLGHGGKHESLIRAEAEEIEPLTRSDIEALYERDLFEDLDDCEKQARETLEAAGLPTEFHRPYKRADGSICGDLDGLIDDDRKLEPEGYAATIMGHIEDTRACLEKGDAVQAARAAMQLQYVVDHQHFSKYEHETLVGMAQRTANRDSARKPRRRKLPSQTDLKAEYNKLLAHYDGDEKRARSILYNNHSYVTRQAVYNRLGLRFNNKGKT